MPTAPPPPPPVVLLGCGFVGLEIARQALGEGRAVQASTRSADRFAELVQCGVDPFLTDWPPPLEHRHVIVTFPPDPIMDCLMASRCQSSTSVVYVSSTAVYGSQTGLIDGRSEVRGDAERARRRIAAEDTWRACGAVVLRAPGIYGPGRGVHRRLRAGTFRLTGTGDNYQSRIHVHDLAAMCLAALGLQPRGSAWVVGDAAPTTQRVLVEHLCAALDLPLPPACDPDEAHPTLRADRRVDGTASLRALGHTLRFPSYAEGYADALLRDAAP